MRVIIISFVALFIAACGQESQVNSQPPAPAPAASQTRSAAELLAAFRTEISTCASAVQTFERDRAFIKEFTDASKRESKPLSDFLRQASFANSGDIQYILGNPKYFVVDVSFHPTEFAIAWVSNEPIYCAVSRLRLEEIEGLGVSPEAWEVRSHFLNRWLKDLSSPSNESDFDPEQYEAFNQFVTTASKLYSPAFGSELSAWGKTAIAHIESQRGGLQEGAGGQTLSEQNKILDKEVAFLTSLLQPTGAESAGGTQPLPASAPAAGV